MRIVDQVFKAEGQHTGVGDPAEDAVILDPDAGQEFQPGDIAPADGGP